MQTRPPGLNAALRSRGTGPVGWQRWHLAQTNITTLVCSPALASAHSTVSGRSNITWTCRDGSVFQDAHIDGIIVIQPVIAVFPSDETRSSSVSGSNRSSARVHRPTGRTADRRQNRSPQRQPHLPSGRAEPRLPPHPGTLSSRGFHRPRGPGAARSSAPSAVRTR